jgi:anti-sigma B factor antagonist
MRVRTNLTADSAAQVVCIESRLDVSTAARVRPMLHLSVGDGKGDLIVDLSAVELIDATGLGVLVGAHRHASREGRRLVLRGVPPRVMRLLAMTRLHRVLHVEVPQDAVA